MPPVPGRAGTGAGMEQLLQAGTGDSHEPWLGHCHQLQRVWQQG